MPRKYYPRPNVPASAFKVGTVRAGRNSIVKWVVKLSANKTKRWCRLHKPRKTKTVTKRKVKTTTKKKTKTTTKTKRKTTTKTKTKTKIKCCKTTKKSVIRGGARVPNNEAPSRQARREGRPSPSESATIHKPRTVMYGNDDNLWVVRLVGPRKIHRWVRLPAHISH